MYDYFLIVTTFMFFHIHTTELSLEADKAAFCEELRAAVHAMFPHSLRSIWRGQHLSFNFSKINKVYHFNHF